MVNLTYGILWLLAFPCASQWMNCYGAKCQPISDSIFVKKYNEMKYPMFCQYRNLTSNLENNCQSFHENKSVQSNLTESSLTNFFSNTGDAFLGYSFDSVKRQLVKKWSFCSHYTYDNFYIVVRITTLIHFISRFFTNWRFMRKFLTRTVKQITL